MKQKKRIPTPHDATFRQFLKYPEIARDFMELHLPAELCAFRGNFAFASTANKYTML